MQARWKRRLAAAGASATAIGLAVSGSAVAAPAPGAAGIGDAYYPEYGNGGYDVDHYGISIGYTPSTGRLTGRTTITAKATQDLSRFNLDFALTASAVTVNGAPATISTRSRELIVTPAAPVVKDSTMTVVVTYAGIPTTVAGSPWVKTPDGAVALGEPEISAWWFPGNDHPRDKATYDVTMTVPTGIEALSNGTLTSHTSPVGKEVWAWRESKPMATYLAFMAIGQYDVARSTTAAGLPVVTAVASNGGAAGAAAKIDLARTAEVVDWHAGRWGPYAFDATGGVAPNADFGFALENQTRPVYSRLFWTSRRTSGSATASRSTSGRTSGSTRASPPTPSGSGRPRTARAPRPRRSPRPTAGRRPARSGRSRSATPASATSSTAPSTTEEP
jgi:hypothetical protein